MAEFLSPLGAAYVPGRRGNLAAGVQVTLSEVQYGSIVQAGAWPGRERDLLAAIRGATGLALADGAGAGIFTGGRAAFGIAPGRFLIATDSEGLAQTLLASVPVDLGTVTDLSHGRTVFRIAGPRADWVLAKFFAVDLALAAFPEQSGLSTAHHDIFAQIQRTGSDRFELYVFRSFARSFWTSLCHASEEVGYEVI